MNYNSLLDTKKKLIYKNLIKLELKLKQLNTTKTNIQSKINNQSHKYDKINISIDEKINSYKDKINNLDENILKLNRENDTLKNQKILDLEKENLIYKNEKTRNIEKIKEIHSKLNKELDTVNNLINILKENNKDIKDYIQFTTSKNKSYIKSKYIIRQNYKTKFNEYKNKTKLKKKNILLFKKKVISINDKINHLYNEFNNNIEKRDNAVINFNIIDDKIKRLKILLSEKEETIQFILNKNLNYSENNLETNYYNQTDNFNRNETSLISIVKEKDEIKNKITLLSENPEYNLEKYYNTIDNKNNNILKEIDILTNNKFQFEEKLENQKNNTSIHTTSNNNSNICNHKIILNNNLFLKKLNDRLKKNETHINYLNLEIIDINNFYNQQFEKENGFKLRSENRLTISKNRIDEKHMDNHTKINLDIEANISKIQDIKNEINILLNKKKICISKKKELFSNHNPYIKNIKHEITTLNNKIITMNNLLNN